MSTIDLETLLKHYTEGRISKKEFVYLHSLITRAQQPARPKAKLNPRGGQTASANPTAGALAPSNTGILQFLKSRYKSVAAFMGSLWLFATLAVNYLNGTPLPFKAPDSEPQSGMVQQAPVSKPTPRAATKKDIQMLAAALRDEPIWEAYAVNEFTTQWIMLSAQQKGAIKNAAWYGDFVDQFKKQVKFERARRIDGGVTVDIENRHRALMQLAVSLGMVSSTPTSLAKLDEVLSPAPSPKSKAKDEPKAKSKTTQQPTQPSTQPSIRNSKAKAIAQTKPATKAAAAAIKSSVNDKSAINGREIMEVIDQYVAAFETGNKQQMLALFADDEALRRPLSLKSLREQYTDLFRSTDERWVEFREMSWEKLNREIRGQGKFRTSLRLMPDGDYKTVTTDVKIAMYKAGNVLRITDFDLNDSSIFAMAMAQQKKSAIEDFSAKDRPKYPTQGELQDVITQYMDSYQTGDIGRMMELFASATWTADSSGLEELRREYADLFRTTSDRQVFISNLDWTFKNNKAMGTGDLVINLLSTQDHKITRKKGKLRLIVEKNLQKARISHLFQIVN